MGHELSLGIDLGGTKMLALLLDESGKALATAKSDTDSSIGPDGIAEMIFKTAGEAISSAGAKLEDVPYVGVAVPSPVDHLTGDCHHAPNLGWRNFSMKGRFKKLFGKDVHLGNDANLGILGEYHYGAAKGFKSAAGFFVGTGLGGGIIMDGRLVIGNGGLAGEVGHMVIRYGGRRCRCGRRGCLEAYCSKVAFMKALKREVFKRGTKTTLSEEKFDWKSNNIKSRRLAKAYNAADAAVCKVVDGGFKRLGAGAAAICAAIAPDCIVLGGGVVSALGKELMPVFQKSFERHLFGLPPSKIKVRLSELGDLAVATGACVLARRNGEV